jgi:hypothetical protein
LDGRTVLEGLDADHGRLLAEIARLKDSIQWVVNESRKTAEPDVRTSLADRLREFVKTLAATEREREAVQQLIDAELGELMDDSFVEQHPTLPAAGMCSDDDGDSEDGSEDGDCRSEEGSEYGDCRSEEGSEYGDCRSELGDDDSDPTSSGSGSAAVQGARFEQTADTKRKRRKKAKTAAENKRRKSTPQNPGKVSSKFFGVGWHKRNQKWSATFRHNGKKVHLGDSFDTELAAAKAVDVWLRENGRAAEANLDESGSFVPRVSMKSSRFRGVSWCKSHNQWQAQIKVAGKMELLGFFDDEAEAARAFDTRAAELGRPTNFDLNGVEIDYSA